MLRRSSRLSTATSKSPERIKYNADSMKITIKLSQLGIKTPTKSPKKGTPRKTQSFTPRNVMKMVREGVLTPTASPRVKKLQLDRKPLSQAKSNLHVSYLPDNLPCRETEFANIYHFLSEKLLDGCGGCMYISGVPGTGKTATVTAVLKKLQKLSKSKELPMFEYASVNGLKLTEPRQTYVEIMRQLTGKTYPWEQALNLLDDRFSKKSKNSAKRQLPIILIIDELDMVCTKRQEVVYNLLDWPTRSNHQQLIVLTIANTMDLPERLLLSRITSRLGLTRLTFQPYTYKQLQEIISMRLSGLDNFHADAIQLVARKVASVSGDARRALDICRRATELAENTDKFAHVGMEHINQALKAMIAEPKVVAVKQCSLLEQLILKSVVAEVERTGVEETVFADVFKMLKSLCAIEGVPSINCTVALMAVQRLYVCRLLLVDQKAGDIEQRIVLNVSPDDIYYALK